MEFRPLGLWNDTWRVYALGLLLVCIGVSAICGAVFSTNLPEQGFYLAAIVIAAGAGVGILAGLSAVLAYLLIGADSRPLVRWLWLSIVNGSAPVALLLLLLGARLFEILEIVVPLIGLHAVWTGVFLVGRRSRPPLPISPLSRPRGWDSQH